MNTICITIQKQTLLMEELRLNLNDKVLLSFNFFLLHSLPLCSFNPPANYVGPYCVFGNKSPNSNEIVVALSEH